MRLRIVLGVSAIIAGCSGPTGPDGKPCTVKDNGNGTATVTCGDGTTATISNGPAGTPGAPGTQGNPGGPGTPGMPGQAGTSCTVTSNPDAGTKTISCTDGTSVTLLDGRNGVDVNATLDFTKLTPFDLEQDDFSVTVQSVSNVARPVVRFTVRSRKGQGVKGIPVTHFGGIALLQLVPGTPTPTGNGQALDTWVSHISNCATCTASTENATSTSLIDNSDGSYTYTFAKDVITPTPFDGGVAVAGVAFDGNAPHRLGLRVGDPLNDIAGQKVNSYRPVDVVYDYIPVTGANVDGQNEKVNLSNCLSCHNDFRAQSSNKGGRVPFHGGQRYDVRYCVVCHNSQRRFSGNSLAGNAVIAEPTIAANGTLTPPAGRTNISVLRGEAIIDLPIFAHKIHSGENLSLKGNYAGLGTEINEFAFPQDVRNCTRCHSSAAKADNWQTKVSRKACGSCHDGVNFVTGQGHGQANLAQANDNSCLTCHDPTTSLGVPAKHLAVAPPDPGNSLLVPGGSSNTNASFIGNTANPPAGARVFKYDLNSVTTTDGGTGVFPVVKFRFTEGDAGVVFNPPTGTNELLTGFVGAPSVYCVFAVPQDGIARPADFNASISGYLKTLWNSTTSAGSLTGPDTTGYYTATLTGGRVPFNASMLTCGLGYSYSLSSALPLTQTDVPGYPYSTTARTGGISLPPTNVWKVATGYTGRRGATASTSQTGQIASTQRCASCHNNLGVSPTYHSGQRNDAATCSFCHNQNRNSSGWTAGSESFIHAIHAAKLRTTPFNWHAVGATEDHPSPRGFFGVEYPGRLNYCESCHNPGYYDFSAAWYTPANVSTRIVQTVATGVYDAVTPTADGGVPALAVSVSPYVIADGGFNYGPGFSFNAGSGATSQGADTNLVISPISNTCFGCHDGPAARAHIENNGGVIYGTRPQYRAAVEQCLVCHGPGKAAAIKEVHYR